MHGSCRQILTYGRRIPLEELFARIDAVDQATVKRVATRFIFDKVHLHPPSWQWLGVNCLNGHCHTCSALIVWAVCACSVCITFVEKSWGMRGELDALICISLDLQVFSRGGLKSGLSFCCQDIAIAAMGPTLELPDYLWFRRRTYWLRYWEGVGFSMTFDALKLIGVEHGESCFDISSEHFQSQLSSMSWIFPLHPGGGSSLRWTSELIRYLQNINMSRLGWKGKLAI